MVAAVAAAFLQGPPFMWDCFFSGTVSTRFLIQLVLPSSAVLQRIRHSDVFKKRFAKYVRRMAGHEQSRVKDMASAKQRFLALPPVWADVRVPGGFDTRRAEHLGRARAELT